MKTQTEKVKVSQQNQVITKEQANNLLKQMMNDEGSFKQNTTLTLPFNNWEALQNSLNMMLQLPLFNWHIADWMLKIEESSLEVIYNSNHSWGLKVNAYRNIFHKDLIMDAITNTLGTLVINFPKFCKWKPFGGTEFYYGMKDAFYSNKMTNTFVLGAVKNTIERSKRKLIKDPNLPINTNVNPHKVEISIIALDKMIVTYDHQYLECNLSTQRGLHGTQAFWNMKSKKGNKNWEMLIDLLAQPDKLFDRTATTHKAFSSGESPYQVTKASKEMSNLEKALSHIFVLGEEFKWFKKEGSMYIPNFKLSGSLFDVVEKATHEVRENKRYNAYDDDQLDYIYLEEESRNGLIASKD